MKYILYPILIGSAGVYVSNVSNIPNAWFLHSISVDNVQVKPNGIVLRYFNRDGLRRRPNL